MSLAGMRERVSLLNGRLVIDSSPGEGTRIRVEIPLPAGALATADPQRGESYGIAGAC